MVKRQNMKILILDQNAWFYQKALKEEFPGIEINAATLATDAEVYIDRADVLIAVHAPDELIAKAKNLAWIQSLISGLDFFTNLPSLNKNILLTSGKGIHGPQVSETAFLLMLALNRKYNVNFKDRMQKRWIRWPSTLLHNKAVGILGVGVIGKEIARKCKAFNMTVHGMTSTKRAIENVDYSYDSSQLTEIFAKADYIINILPSNPKTRKSIGKAQFEAMKPTAFFINVGRGDTVEETVLIDFIKNHRIAGAGLDVFEIEPLAQDNPLWELENVVLTPHIGGASDIYREQILPVLKINIRKYLNGELKKKQGN